MYEQFNNRKMEQEVKMVNLAPTATPSYCLPQFTVSGNTGNISAPRIPKYPSAATHGAPLVYPQAMHLVPRYASNFGAAQPPAFQYPVMDSGFSPQSANVYPFARLPGYEVPYSIYGISAPAGVERSGNDGHLQPSANMSRTRANQNDMTYLNNVKKFESYKKLSGQAALPANEVDDAKRSSISFDEKLKEFYTAHEPLHADRCLFSASMLTFDRNDASRSLHSCGSRSRGTEVNTSEEGIPPISANSSVDPTAPSSNLAATFPVIDSSMLGKQTSYGVCATSVDPSFSAAPPFFYNERQQSKGKFDIEGISSRQKAPNPELCIELLKLEGFPNSSNEWDSLMFSAIVEGFPSKRSEVNGTGWFPSQLGKYGGLFDCLFQGATLWMNGSVQEVTIKIMEQTGFRSDIVGQCQIELSSVTMGAPIELPIIGEAMQSKGNLILKLNYAFRDNFVNPDISAQKRNHYLSRNQGNSVINTPQPHLLRRDHSRNGATLFSFFSKYCCDLTTDFN